MFFEDVFWGRKVESMAGWEKLFIEAVEKTLIGAGPLARKVLAAEPSQA
jgi:hypothetical protein